MKKRDQVSDQVIKLAMKNNHGVIAASAREISKLTGVKVSAQLLRYWVSDEKFQKEREMYKGAEAVLAQRRMHVKSLESARSVREISDYVIKNDTWEADFLSTLSELKLKPIRSKAPLKKKKRDMIAELHLSDVHYGVLIPGETSLDIIDLRLEEIMRGFTIKLLEHAKNYNITKIILLLNGDLVELGSHGDTGSEVSPPQQMVRAIEGISSRILMPLAETGYPIEVICTPGNHAHTGRGIQYSIGGRTTEDYVLYSSLKLIMERVSPNFTFTIPSGIYQTYKVFHEWALVSHGTECKPTEVGMTGYASKIALIEKKVITISAIGHYHICNIFDAGAHVSNGSCVKDTNGQGFSGAKGYHSAVIQMARFYVERKNKSRSSVYDVFPIQAGHIG